MRRAAPILREHRASFRPLVVALAQKAAAEADTPEGPLPSVYGLLHETHAEAWDMPSPVRAALHAVAQAIHENETGR